MVEESIRPDVDIEQKLKSNVRVQDHEDLK